MHADCKSMRIRNVSCESPEHGNMCVNYLLRFQLLLYPRHPTQTEEEYTDKTNTHTGGKTVHKIKIQLKFFR